MHQIINFITLGLTIFKITKFEKELKLIINTIKEGHPPHVMRIRRHENIYTLISQNVALYLFQNLL